jgi:alginate O-acetyltransferase complex protein AlgI
MQLDSLAFLFLFLPVLLVLFSLVRGEARQAFLLAASLFLYAWGEGSLVLLLLVLIAANYLFGRGLDAARARPLRRGLFLAALAFNIGTLVYYKYIFFFLGALKLRAYLKPGPRIPLPLGISFIVFQALSYAIDVYLRRTRAAANPLRFGLYLAFFPKIVSGPLISFQDFDAQASERRPLADGDLIAGIRRTIIGLGKHVLIAATLGGAVDKIFGLPPGEWTAALAWAGIIGFTLQIYFDFSGYTDMAVGLGLLLGYRLPENFNAPYRARSIGDFWKRWHMSFTRWLQAYLFLPIAYAVSRRIPEPRRLGIRAESWAYAAGTMTAFLVCGLWHGANWTFVLWGAYYGVLLVLEQAGLGRWMKRRWAPFRHLYCLFLVMMGWVLFRSASLSAAGEYFRALFGFGRGDGLRHPLSLFLDSTVWAAAAAGAIAILPIFSRLAKAFPIGAEDPTRPTRPVPALLTVGYGLAYNLALFLIALGTLLVIAHGTHLPFLYERF